MPSATVDFGYTHIFIKDPRIDNRNDGSTAGFGLLDGTYKSDVNIFSLGATFAFR
jgi:long-subunit fatty acid transport protein